ncbi:MAG TPA: ParB/RepB/Spo0J family partition protein [Pirellulales bacterium]|nr:ParB/RepB/Spo0J family partition protein [Pirellulales bacterium]
MKEEIAQVPLDKIDCAPQVREIFDEQLIAGLAASLKEIGQLQPVRLLKHGERFLIEDGERRYRACKLAGFRTITAIIEARQLTEADVLLRQCACDFQRVDLSPMEKAVAIDRLMQATGWKAVEVATRLGVSTATVSRLLSLLTHPEHIKQALKEGKIPGSAGFELAKIEDAQVREDFFQKLMEGTITRDGVAGARKAAERGKNGKPPAAVKRVTAMLGGGRAVTVCTQDDTLDGFISALEDTLAKARRGRSMGFALDTLLRLLRDQAEAA